MAIGQSVSYGSPGRAHLVGPACEGPVTAPGVVVACSMLSDELERVENQAARLYERIGAVLRPEPIDPAGSTGSQDGRLSPLAQGIQRHAARVASITDQLADIANRIDL